MASAPSSRRQARRQGHYLLDIATYETKTIGTELKKTSVATSVSLAVRTNRKDKLGANWADHDRCGMTEDELTAAQEVLDAKYLRHVNRALTRAPTIVIRGPGICLAIIIKSLVVRLSHPPGVCVCLCVYARAR